LTGSRSGSRSRSSPSADLPRPKKRFGQHFLSDTNILDRIVAAADLRPQHAVVEVGPGLGALTDVLATRASRVVAVEIDPGLVAVLRDRFAGRPNVAIIEADVIDLAPSQVLARGRAAAPYVVVANLPYNVAAFVLRQFLEGDVKPERLVVMVQKEVAEAIVARPGKMTLIGVATQAYGEARFVMRVAPGAFRPPPAVESAVVRIDVAARPRVTAPLDVFFRVVRAGFGNPRKQLRNALSYGLHVKQEAIDEALRAAGVDVTLRAQALSLEQWDALASAWAERTRR
jgi:16S rRNA (adenine1518-N6/adenine1519-N6)-dimethyltransferase